VPARAAGNRSRERPYLLIGYDAAAIGKAGIAHEGPLKRDEIVGL
jgi:hypothetical protein